MRFNFLLTTLFSFILTITNAQVVPPKLDSIFNYTLDSMQNLLNVKGLAAAVQLSSGAVWSGGAGISSEDIDDTITVNHVFGIGSVNKTITGACILQLVDEGVLSLDDSLHSWIYPINFVNPNITIRQLLRHQSGLYDVITDPGFGNLMLADQDSVWKWDILVKTLIKAPLALPGGSFNYCNTNYLLLGYIIEQATGNPYHQEIKDRFWTPLSLSTPILPPYEAYPDAVAHLWLDTNGDGTIEDANDFFSNWDSWHSGIAPPGGYFSTPADMAVWMRAYMSGTLLSPATFAAMKTTITTNFPSGTKYGLGMMQRQIFAQKALGHGGDIGYSASVWYFPNKDISIAVLNNDGSKNSWDLAPTVAALMKEYTLCEAQITGNQELVSGIKNIITYPNPFINELNIVADYSSKAQNIQFILTNALGETIAVSAIMQKNSDQKLFKFENLETLATGIYFLNIYLDGVLAKEQSVVYKK
jgi:D-alanyl-D-alanine carboxypeptidase